MVNTRAQRETIQKGLKHSESLWGISVKLIGQLEKNLSSWRVPRELGHYNWFKELRERVGEELADYEVCHAYSMMEVLRKTRSSQRASLIRNKREEFLLDVARTATDAFKEIDGREWHSRAVCEFGLKEPKVEVRGNELRFYVLAGWKKRTEGLPRTWLQGGNKKWVMDCHEIEGHALCRDHDVKVYKATLFGKRTEAQLQKQLDALNAEYAQCDDPSYAHDLSEEANELLKLMRSDRPHLHTGFVVQSQTATYAETGNKISALADSAQTALKLIDRRARDEFVRQIG